MPVTLTYPGVYVEEIPSGVHTIVGLPTSITAFVGRAAMGPVGQPVDCFSYADYVGVFGGAAHDDKSVPLEMSYAVQDFFMNGGGHAIIVRLVNDAGSAAATGPIGDNALSVVAVSPGSWGNRLVVTLDPPTSSESGSLSVGLQDPQNPKNFTASENFSGFSLDASSPKYLGKVLKQQSMLVRLGGSSGTPGTPKTGDNGLAGGADSPPKAAAFALGNGYSLVAASTGSWGNQLTANVTAEKGDDKKGKYDVTVTLTEKFGGCSLDASAPNYIGTKLKGSRSFV